MLVPMASRVSIGIMFPDSLMQVREQLVRSIFRRADPPEHPMWLDRRSTDLTDPFDFRASDKVFPLEGESWLWRRSRVWMCPFKLMALHMPEK